MIEEWKDIKGYEGLYQISNFGRLKSFHSNKDGEIRSVINSTGWYLSTTLCKNGKIKSFRIHQLVAHYFIERPQYATEVNHKDMNKQNNHVDNLEWVTRSQNVRHAVKNNPDFLKPMNNYNQNIKPIPVAMKNKNGITLFIFKNCIEASKATGVCSRNILQVASRTEYKPGMIRSQAGGYKWEFAEKGEENGA